MDVGKKMHWVACNGICKSKEERGLGFRSLFDVSRTLFSKLWWIVRTQKTLRTNFMWNMYCKKVRPQFVEWKGGSLI